MLTSRGPALCTALQRAAPGGIAAFHSSARRCRGARVAVNKEPDKKPQKSSSIYFQELDKPLDSFSFVSFLKWLLKKWFFSFYFVGFSTHMWVLSGCGVYDGTEIHEASAVLVHLSRGGAEVQMYAPDVPQMHVIDHSKGQPAEAESRNVLVESARIARGKIASLAKLTTADHDAVIFPGGFGAAKNLSTFAVDGKDCKVNREVERVLKDFHKAGKPIGLCCISPVLAAKVLSGAEVTVGHEEEEGGKWPYAGTAGAIKELGAKHCVKEVTEAHVDTKNKVVTTPAFMCETALHHIFDGIGAMVKNVLKLTGK